MGNLRTNLFRFYNWAQPLIVPGLRNAQFAYKETLETKLLPETRWLDIGCGRRLFPPWMPQSEQIQIAMTGKVNATFGLDPDFASLRDNRFVQYRVQGDSSALPFAGDSFDLLTANMVVEHVANPVALLSEAFRVLKPNGFFLFHTPNLLSYATLTARIVPEAFKVGLIRYLEGRKGEDVFPTLYRMNTPEQVEKLASAAGFAVVELKRTESSAQAVMLGPLVILELLWIRMLRLRTLSNLRSNLIVILQKPGQQGKSQIASPNPR
jgi:ubiquinone/menaquinone biosynthesis C-methylase UbiE